ncbi:hypothetical protein ATU3B_15720 [Agrobacterium genomosp. 3 str. CIP 111-78]|nr:MULTISPECIES: hypothetical protein [Agrobacterium tumefaciens complex]MCA2373074.1 hypothetical protein [Agrobacterium tomkonis CIP 111-78]
MFANAIAAGRDWGGYDARNGLKEKLLADLVQLVEFTALFEDRHRGDEFV